MTLNMQYFEILREMINSRLLKLSKDERENIHARDQIEKYTWLYGALGKVPSDVMFICENPSVTGIDKASRDTTDGGRPDIEAQWWGGSTDFAATRFRVALYILKLKTTRPRERGGWECYITNVIKQSNIAIHQEHKPSVVKNQQARDWADVLQWELDHVKPKYVFCVGENAHKYVSMLQRERLLSRFPVYEVIHYSARGKTQAIINSIVSSVQIILNK